MSSKKTTEVAAFVWIWLPEETTPVVAGKLSSQGSIVVFNYGRSYLARKNAIPIYDIELPLKPGILPLLPGLSIPGCIRDASPDAWGRRVIINRKLSIRGTGVEWDQLDELTFLLESGSDRIGALDFQRSATHYEPRSVVSATLEELLQSAERVEQGIPLTPELDAALNHGSSIGGARPKALIETSGKKFIAKFSSSTDFFNVVKAEFIAMRLASHAGLHVAAVSLTRALSKDVLLVERFDRSASHVGWQRKCIVSALTLLGLDEMMARYASYEDFAHIIRQRFTNPAVTLIELFGRITFNILTGNTDDHARNHAAIWDGTQLSLAPAYDICPQSRSGNEATQAMLIVDDNRMSRLASCFAAAHLFLLSERQAYIIIEQQIRSILEHWHIVCEEARVTQTERKLLWGRQFLNPFAFEGLKGEQAALMRLSDFINPK